jgi:hypothetical protein
MISAALGLAGVFMFLFVLHLVHIPGLGQMLFKPGTLLAPLIMNVMPSEWGAGGFGEDGRLLYATVVNLSALAVWWTLFSIGIYFWLKFLEGRRLTGGLSERGAASSVSQGEGG